MNGAIRYVGFLTEGKVNHKFILIIKFKFKIAKILLNIFDFVFYIYSS